MLPAVSLAVAAVSLAVIAGALQHLLTNNSVSLGWALLLIVIIRLVSAWAMLWLLERHAGRSRTWEVASYTFIIVMIGPDLARHVIFGLGWDQMKLIGLTGAFAGAVYQMWEQIENRGRWVHLIKGIYQIAAGILLILFLNTENNWNLFSIIVIICLFLMMFFGLRNLWKQFAFQY